MELRSQVLEGKLLHPDTGFASARTRLEQRWDPLTGHASRLVSSPDELFPPNTYDLARLAEETRTGCPFCPDLVEMVTPQLAPHVWPQGRIRRGRALLFPNLRAYAKHPSVAVYDPELHYLPLARLDAALVGDLAAQVDFARAALEADSASTWVSINANHMLPSGSSLFHPHTQGAAHPQPTTMQALLAAVPPERFDDYLATERRLGQRHLGGTGTIEWLASFAPLGPAELRAFLPGVASPSNWAATASPSWPMASSSRSVCTPSSASKASTWRSTARRPAPPATR